MSKPKTTNKTETAAKASARKPATTSKTTAIFAEYKHLTPYAALIALVLVIAVAFVITNPFASEVDAHIERALHANDLRIDRLEAVAINDAEDATDWKYLAVLSNNDVTAMISMDAMQYMMLREGDVVVGHLVVMTNGEGAFTFDGEANDCDVICYKMTGAN